MKNVCDGDLRVELLVNDDGAKEGEPGVEAGIDMLEVKNHDLGTRACILFLADIAPMDGHGR